jgi:hypothetical protein
MTAYYEHDGVDVTGMDAAERAQARIHALIGDVDVLSPLGRRLGVIEDSILASISDRNALRQIVANLAATNPWHQNERGDIDCCFFCQVEPYDTETHADRGCVWRAARDAMGMP